MECALSSLIKFFLRQAQRSVDRALIVLGVANEIRVEDAGIPSCERIVSMYLRQSLSNDLRTNITEISKPVRVSKYSRTQCSLLMLTLSETNTIPFLHLFDAVGVSLVSNIARCSANIHRRLIVD
jgi:hypothetical protein